MVTSIAVRTLLYKLSVVTQVALAEPVETLEEDRDIPVSNLNFFIVQTDNYLGRGREYVHRMLASVQRWMPSNIPVTFWVITDDPSCVPVYARRLKAEAGVTGWWHILECFKDWDQINKPGDRCMYWDIDQLAVGPLDDLLSFDGGFAMLRDIYYPKRLADGVMSWQAGQGRQIWEVWNNAGRPIFDGKTPEGIGGSQAWIEGVMGSDNVTRLQDRFPKQLVSFKKDCLKRGGLPPHARVLIFHGEPRPHATGEAWVDKLWYALPYEERA